MVNNKCWGGWGNLGTLGQSMVGMDSGTATRENRQLLKMFRTELFFHPVISTPRFIANRTEKWCPHKNLYTNVHSSIFQNSQSAQPPKCPPIDEWGNKVWHSSKCSLIQSSGSMVHAEKRTHVKKPWKYTATWKSQTQKATDCRIPFIWNVHNKEIPRRKAG